MLATGLVDSVAQGFLPLPRQNVEEAKTSTTTQPDTSPLLSSKNQLHTLLAQRHASYKFLLQLPSLVCERLIGVPGPIKIRLSKH